MKRTLTAFVMSACLFTSTAFAANPKVDAAVKTFAVIEADAGKLKQFCEMFKTMTDASNEQDEAKAKALEEKIAGQIKALGDAFGTAWDLQGELDENTADGKTYFAAIDKMIDKCPQ